MANKEQIEHEIQSISRRNGFKLVDFNEGHRKAAARSAEKDAGERAKPTTPIRFEGKGLLGKLIIIHIPKRYCLNGNIDDYAMRRLAAEGFCGFAERSRDIYNCRMIFRVNHTDQWRIEVTE